MPRGIFSSSLASCWVIPSKNKALSTVLYFSSNLSTCCFKSITSWFKLFVGTVYTLEESIWTSLLFLLLKLLSLSIAVFLVILYSHVNSFAFYGLYLMERYLTTDRFEMNLSKLINTFLIHKLIQKYYFMPFGSGD